MLRRMRFVGCIKGNAYAALDAPKPNFVYSDTLMTSLDESTFKEGVLPGDPHGSHNTVPNSTSALTGFEVLDGPPSDDRGRGLLPPGLPGRGSPVIALLKVWGFGIAAVAAAAGHHAYNMSLNNTPADRSFKIAGQSISAQKKASDVATAFIFLVKLLCTMCVATAFDQRLWYTSHRQFIKLRGLNALYNLLDDPFAFRELEIFRAAKLATLIALVSWCIPLGVLPVPGSLSTHSITTQTVRNVSVPSVDLLQTTTPEPATYNPLRFYNGPQPQVMKVSSSALTSEAIPSWSSPCGPSCSYNLTFFAPSFNCTARVDLANQTSLLKWEALAVPGDKEDVFQVQWLSNYDTQTQSSANCSSFNSTYDITVSFSNGVQSVDVRKISLLSPFGTADPTIWNQADPSGDPGGNPNGQAYLAAVTASVVTALQGSIFLDRQIGLQLNGTGLVMYSALLNTSSTDAGLDFLEFLPNTPQLIQDILTNTSIGMMSQPFWNTTTLATIDTTSTVFSYDPSVLWAGYGACLGVAFVAIMIAAYSVWANGGSGDRSFALIVATTRSSTLDRLFKATARPEDIMDVPLRYGRLSSYQDSGSLGFGTSEGLDTTS